MTLSLGLILAVAALVCCLLYAWHAPREASPRAITPLHKRRQL